jgi:hypothetical protein
MSPDPLVYKETCHTFNKEKTLKKMKIVSKIAILVGFVAFVSSCEKEKLPVPHSLPAVKENTANQRNGGVNPADTASSMVPVYTTPNTNPSDIVGGGDDDRDGGGIVGGGDDDRDGGGARKGKNN